ncbi:DivIVA domain-containing protein [Saccharopolyspora sp. K220]|uniref:DivIVA domain-containing protein n=1 Tax=Saccharopolyspora soli TaxID=2926618 RepID=UPI001F5A8DA6|nr:DivIVA domain-containing protein [Saccharopolyspora soli]MCI2416061.1 DivIVA domain-containing protein [Saccharopolyspora soli]
MRMLTPDEVHDVVFARTRRRGRGYDEAEVDDFLDRVAAALSGRGVVTAREVLAVEFSPRRPGRHAYKKTQVDAFLDKVALTLMKREVRESGGDRGRRPVRTRPARVAYRPPEAVEPVAELVPSGHVDVFQGAAPQQPALDKAEVDAFMDRVEATLRGEDTLTAQEVLSVRFNPPGPGKPGYQEASVVAFLVMVATSIKHLASRKQLVPAQRMPIARAFRRESRTGTPQLTADAIGNLVLSTATPGEPGYDEDEVDDFLDRVEATLRGKDTLTSQDVQTVAFRELADSDGGYDREEVDSLLDLIEERLDTDALRVRRPVREHR